MSRRFHPKSRRLFPFYFSNITLRPDLLTFGVTGTVFKIAGEIRRLPAYFDNHDSDAFSVQFCIFTRGLEALTRMLFSGHRLVCVRRVRPGNEINENGEWFFCKGKRKP